MIKTLLGCLFVGLSFFADAQTCTGPGRTAGTAKAVCALTSITESDVSSCTGPNLFNSVCPDAISTDNSRWYKFHCYTSGTFGFLVQPNSSGDDYDWAVMDVTGRNPTDVFTTNLVISFNLSAQTGATGCTASGTLNSHCAGGTAGSQYNQLLNLVAGHDYFLMVTNWSNSGTPYTISFSGTAALVSPIIPAISNVTVANCSPTQLNITFSDDLLCSSITASGSELTVTGGTAATVTAVQSNCSTGASTALSAVATLSNALAPGNYNLVVAIGSDGDTYENVCHIPVAPVSIPFIVPAPPAAPAVSTPALNYCIGDAAPPLTATGTNLLWYTVPSSGSTTAPIPLTNVASVTTYYVSQTSGVCESPRAAITVTVNSPVTPTFNPVAAICSGDALSPLPTASGNSITGTWSPALDNTATTTYTFTPAAGQCATAATLTITVNQPTVPAFTAVAPICSGATLVALPTTSNNGVTGTWSPALDNTNTTTYTFTPSAGVCATTATMTITVNPVITPTFTAIAPICAGGTFTLPTTSNNGITGTWSPAVNNSATTTYTFTADAGQCVTSTVVTMTVTVNPNVVPTFTAVATICSGDVLSPLPTTSNNGINGTWSPALDNTNTTTYTFTPAAGVCATTATMTITVNQPTVPAFTAVAPICAGGTLSALPTTSNNSISGTWSPALDNTTTTTYTFTPAAGVCATTATMTITVNPIVTPSFTAVAPICSGATLAALPTTSNNGITGTWSPVLDNTNTTTYTFTPSAGQCAVTNTMTITVNPNVVPTFTAVAPICAGGTLAALPTTSNNGITGTWLPALDNTTTTTYTFTPTPGVCATTATLTITVNPNVVPTFTAVPPACAGSTIAPLPTTSNNGITGTWSPAINNTATTTYTFTPSAGICATTTTLTIQVLSIAPAFTAVAPICTGTIFTLPTTSTNGITGTWSPAPDNTTTTTYTFTPTPGQCALQATMTVTVNPYPTVFIGNDTTICEGASVKFTPTVTPPATLYQWRPEQVNVFVPRTTIDSLFIKDATVNPVDTVKYILSAVLNGCATEDTVQVNVKWKPSVDAGLNTAVCLGDSVLISGLVTHISGFADSLAWTPAGSVRTPDITNSNTIQTWAVPQSSTWYRLTAYTKIAGYGCDFEVHDSVKVVIPAPVIASAGRDTIAVLNAVHQLRGSGGTQYSWWTFSPGVTINHPLTQNPTVVLNNDAKFFVEVKNSIGCTDTASVFVKVYQGPDYYVPNAFSPNGDGLNDIFRAIPPGMATTVYFRVFDRYGNLLFETNQYLKGWDGTYKGKPVPSGIYVWQVKGVDKNRVTVEKQGTVMVVR